MGSVQAPNTCGNTNANTFFGASQASAAGINLLKNGASRMQQQLQQNQPEISCLPISQILAFQQQNPNNSLLHQQLQRHHRDINKYGPKTNAFMCGTVSCKNRYQQQLLLNKLLENVTLQVQNAEYESLSKNSPNRFIFVLLQINILLSSSIRTVEMRFINT